MFFNYSGFSPQTSLELTVLPENKPNIPDFRNSLFWEPDLNAEAGSEVQINFRTSDVVGDYVVLIRGLSDEGKIIVGSSEFRVE